MAQGITGYFDIADSTYNPSRLKLRVYYSETYDVSANKSEVTITKLQAMGTSQYGWTGVTYYPGGTIAINGTTAVTMNSSSGSHSVTISRLDTWYDISGTLGSVTVDHNADGSKTIPIAISVTYYTRSGGAGSGAKLTGTQNVALTTIPRASTFTVSDGTIGTALSVAITRASSSFTHTVKLEFGSYSTQATNATTSASLTPAMEWCNAIPNAESGTATVTVITYNGSTEIGRASKTITLSVPASVVPSVSGTATGQNLFQSLYLQGKSSVTITASANGVYGSTIKSYAISGAGYSGNTASLKTGVLNVTGDVAFTIKSTDSRGRTGTATVTITVIAYSKPAIYVQQYHRCNSDGTLAPDGIYLLVRAAFSCASVNGLNAISATVSYRQRGSSAWLGSTAITTSVSKAVFGSLASDKAYEVRFRAEDAVGEYAEAVVAVESSALNILTAVLGKVCINGMVDQSKADGLQVAGELHLTGALRCGGMAQFDNVICGNGASVSSFKIVRMISSTEMGTGGSSQLYYKAWLKKVCQENPGLSRAIFIGQANPNAYEFVLCTIYNTSALSEDGLPQYSGGFTVNATSGATNRFGTAGYAYQFNGTTY